MIFFNWNISFFIWLSFMIALFESVLFVKIRNWCHAAVISGQNLRNFDWTWHLWVADLTWTLFIGKSFFPGPNVFSFLVLVIIDVAHFKVVIVFGLLLFEIFFQFCILLLKSAKLCGNFCAFWLTLLLNFNALLNFVFKLVYLFFKNVVFLMRKPLFMLEFFFQSLFLFFKFSIFFSNLHIWYFQVSFVSSEHFFCFYVQIF